MNELKKYSFELNVLTENTISFQVFDKLEKVGFIVINIDGSNKYTYLDFKTGETKEGNVQEWR